MKCIFPGIILKKPFPEANEEDLRVVIAQLEQGELSAETKFYGAVIELLDMQRNMLKNKEENTKSPITLQKDVQDLKGSINQILKELMEK